MDIFINVAQALSDSRFWLGPLVLGCLFVMLFKTVWDALGLIEKLQD